MLRYLQSRQLIEGWCLAALTGCSRPRGLILLSIHPTADDAVLPLQGSNDIPERGDPIVELFCLSSPTY